MIGARGVKDRSAAHTSTEILKRAASTPLMSSTDERVYFVENGGDEAELECGAEAGTGWDEDRRSLLQDSKPVCLQQNESLHHLEINSPASLPRLSYPPLGGYELPPAVPRDELITPRTRHKLQIKYRKTFEKDERPPATVIRMDHPVQVVRKKLSRGNPIRTCATESNVRVGLGSGLQGCRVRVRVRVRIRVRVRVRFSARARARARTDPKRRIQGTLTMNELADIPPPTPALHDLERARLAKQGIVHKEASKTQKPKSLPQPCNPNPNPDADLNHNSHPNPHCISPEGACGSGGETETERVV